MQSSSQNVTTDKPTPSFSLHESAHPRLTWGLPSCLDHQKFLVTLGDGCQASRQPSDASTTQTAITKGEFY